MRTSELDAADLVAELGPHLGIECRERLVEQQELRGWIASALRQRHTLLLVARKLVGGISGRPGCPGRRGRWNRVGGSAAARVRADPCAGGRPKATFSARRHVRKQAVGLERHSHIASVGPAAVVMSWSSRRMLPGVEPLEPRQRAQGGGLAASGGAEQGHELAGARSRATAHRGPEARHTRRCRSVGDEPARPRGRRRPALRCSGPPGSCAVLGRGPGTLARSRRRRKAEGAGRRPSARRRARPRRRRGIALAEEVDDDLERIEASAARRS